MHSYRVKVKSRKQTFLIGGAQVQKNARSFIAAAILVLRVDDHGERVRFGVIKPDGSGTAEEFGYFDPGESFAISLQKAVGVYAVCEAEQDSVIDCTVMAEKG